MSELPPLDSLFDQTSGTELSLPAALSTRYGRLLFPIHSNRPHVIGNFVSSLDGVVSLGIAGRAGGREISGDNPHDRMVMGLLRAAAGAVIVGAGTFRASSSRRWTGESACPSLSDAFQAVRTNLGTPDPPMNVVVTASGDLELDRPLDGAGVPLLVVTTLAGATRLRNRGIPASVEVTASASPLTAGRVLQVVREARPTELILVEAGPRLMGEFIAERCLDELFLTIAPQIAGREGDLERPGLVAGKRFAPDDPRWATLVSLKRAGSHLFARYRLTEAW